MGRKNKHGKPIRTKMQRVNASSPIPKAKAQPTLADRAGSSPVAMKLGDTKIDQTTRRYANSAFGGPGGTNLPAKATSSEWDASNGMVLASNGGRAKLAATAAMSEMIGSYTTFGIDPEQDNFDALDMMAQHIIDLLTTGVYTFANLSRFERSLLFRYFYKTNPVIGRLLDLHTDLPLSKARLQAPADIPDIAKDYIMQFYERILARLNFPEFLRSLVLAHGIYGEAIALVDDFYAKFNRVLQDITVIEEHLFDHEGEDQTFLDQVEDAYDKDPANVKVSDRLKYIKLKFKGFFEPDYTGPDRLSVVPFFKVQEYLENDDIDYLAIKYQISESLQQLLNRKVGDEFLHEVGYSEGMTAMLNDPELHEDKAVLLDSDSNDGHPFIFRLRRPEGSSIILRILNEAMEWEAAKRAMRAKIESIGKVGRIVTAPGLSQEQVALLRSEVQLMLDDPGYAIVSNFEVNWQEVNAQLQQQLDDLVGTQDKITEILALGGGMPLTLISGDSQYSGGSIKLEILNVEYHSFKQRVQSMIEEKLFKPIALRKGFITVDDWGNPQICYPRLTFSRVSLRDESVFDILFSLYQKGSLPVSIILDILNLDPDDVKRGIEGDLFTVNDPNFNELVRGLLTAVTDDVHSQTDLASKVIEELGLKRNAVDDGSALEEDGVHDPDSGDFNDLPSSEDHKEDEPQDDAEPAQDPNNPGEDPAPPAPPAPAPAIPKPDKPPSNFDNQQPAWKPPAQPDPNKPADFKLDKK